MRVRLAAAALAASLAGCAVVASGPPIPVAVQPTLAGLTALGFRCEAGVPDNVPSGLIQWRCPRVVNDEGSTVLVDGNDEGVAGLTLVTDTSADPNVARAGFGLLVSAVPPLSTAPILADTLTGWDGTQRVKIVSGVRVSAGCDTTQCIIDVSPTDPPRPLPLP